MNYVFDINIILSYLSDDNVRRKVDSLYNPLDKKHTVILSIVTVREIKSMAQRNSWGYRRINAVERLIKKFLIIDVSSEPMLNIYADIETFSQGKHETKKLNTSARNMGKNDLWIAATTFITKSKLITMDKDFTHLDKVYFDLILMER
ncbi:MAG: PIN domain-containing protein [Saprospiraceae bacterium]